MSRRIFGSFLTWLQEKRKPVFVVATANDLFRLPPELLRKGRFDEIFFVDLPDLDERQNILEIHLRIRNVDPRTFPLSEISAASDGFSGAELEQAVTASLYAAIYLGKSLTPDILLNTLRNSVPLSVTRKEDIVKLRAQAKGRFIPVS